MSAIRVTFARMCRCFWFSKGVLGYRLPIVSPIDKGIATAIEANVQPWKLADDVQVLPERFFEEDTFFDAIVRLDTIVHENLRDVESRLRSDGRRGSVIRCQRRIQPKQSIMFIHHTQFADETLSRAIVAHDTSASAECESSASNQKNKSSVLISISDECRI